MSGEEHQNPWDDFVDAPLPPSAGRILGYLSKRLGSFVPPLSSKTLQRFFNETEDFNVPNETRREILDALAEWLEQTGLLPSPPSGSEYEEGGGIRATLEVFITEWESWRASIRESRLEVPQAILPSIWAPYLRLATIDIALRMAAALAMSPNHAKGFRVLEFWAGSRPGKFLKALMGDASNMTREGLAGALGKKFDKTIDDWLDHDVRPHASSIHQIAEALAEHTEGVDAIDIEADLQRLYLLHDVTTVLREHTGDDLVEECILRLAQYMEYVHRILRAWHQETKDITAASFIQSFGAKSQYALPFLQDLRQAEQDSVWQQDLSAVHGPWHTRVVDATRQAIAARYKQDRWALHDETLDYLGIHADAVREFLDESSLLQHEGRLEDSFPALDRIPDLDRKDARLHEFVGMMKKDWGALKHNQQLLNEALDSFWIAIALDRSRLWSWTGLGHTLVLLGRSDEAVQHLESARSELDTFDSNYFNVLSHAYRAQRRFEDALSALRESIKLSPTDHETLQLAAEVSLLLVKPRRAKQYARQARQNGLPEFKFRELLAAANQLVEHGPPWPTT